MGKLIDVTVYQHAETMLAVMVSESGDASDAVWLPKSQIEIAPSTRAELRVVTMPEWLAMEKGLL